ncbi:hypothetical protein [Rossellomorea marisflavi]|uniref:hypothetical protein n=1 Tax=Rossellomorea marisflavi TaxID=189381 RepID=UPI00345D17DC
MSSIYKDLAQGLLDTVKNAQQIYTWHHNNNLKYGFVHRKDYSGIMAYINPNYINLARKYQGFFDFMAITGEWKSITHITLIDELLKQVTLRDCEAIWRGYIPNNVPLNNSPILWTLAILMFEQEVNFGNEEWQRFSYFGPNLNNPKYKRPRDLLMGYINMAYTQGSVQCLEKFKNNKGQLIYPKAAPLVLEQYFKVLENDLHAEALMVEPIVYSFRRFLTSQPLNPTKVK